MEPRTDAHAWQFADATFSAVVDKGALDALVSDESADADAAVQQYMHEMQPVLDPASGVFLCVTLAQAHTLRAFPVQQLLLTFEMHHDTVGKWFYALESRIYTALHHFESCPKHSAGHISWMMKSTCHRVGPRHERRYTCTLPQTMMCVACPQHDEVYCRSLSCMPIH